MSADTPVSRVRASVVCRRGGELLTVRATDPVTNASYLLLPGGAIEAGESPVDAAVRETLEESGYRVAIVGEPLVFEYPFNWAGRLYDCRTFFYRAELIDPAAQPARVDDDAYLHGVQWLAVDQIEQAFAYHSAVLEAVQRLI